MGPIGRLRRRWISLGIDVRMLIFISVGAIVGDILAWGEGIRNGKSPTASIFCTVLLAGMLIYVWWRMYYELRGPGAAKKSRAASTHTDVGPAGSSDRPRP